MVRKKVKVCDKVYNIDLVIEDVKKFPHTYNSILGKEKGNKTFHVILRRKLNKCLKRGEICKTSIPGTRFGKIIFYYIPKKYFILVESDRIGSNVYVFFEYKRLNKFYIQLSKYWELKKGFWRERNNKKDIFSGRVLKWI